MRVLPVIDLKNGTAVHGVAGNRHQYQPVQSCCCSGAQPVDLFRAWQKWDLHELYLADLTAIENGKCDWRTYRALLSEGARLWVDAGAADVQRCRELLEFDAGESLARVVIALENLVNDMQLEQIARQCDRDRLVFSLDLYDGRIWNARPTWSQVPPEALIARVVQLGIRCAIVLDVAAVGTAQGPVTLALCRRLRTLHPGLEIVSGGGVRDVADLQQLALAGCDRALVATALHNGSIGPAELDAIAQGDAGNRSDLSH